MTEFTKTLTFYVVFTPRLGKKRYWWHGITHRFFGHVFMLKQIDDEKCLLLDPLKHCTVADVVEQDVGSYCVECIQQGATAVLQVTVDYARLPVEPVVRGHYNCVTFVKAVFGMRKTRYTFTPFQLYKKLLKWDTTVAIKPYVPYVEGGRHGRP